MLVLSRKNRESVIVGGGGSFQGLLKVTVLEVNGSRVNLGFEVDADIPVNRLEVWERIRAEAIAGVASGRAAGVCMPDRSLPLNLIDPPAQVTKF